MQTHRQRNTNTQAKKYKHTGNEIQKHRQKKQGQTSFAVSSSQPMARSTENPNCTKSRWSTLTCTLFRVSWATWCNPNIQQKSYEMHRPTDELQRVLKMEKLAVSSISLQSRTQQGWQQRMMEERPKKKVLESEKKEFGRRLARRGGRPQKMRKRSYGADSAAAWQAVRILSCVHIH